MCCIGVLEFFRLARRERECVFKLNVRVGHTLLCALVECVCVYNCRCSECASLSLSVSGLKRGRLGLFTWLSLIALAEAGAYTVQSRLECVCVCAKLEVLCAGVRMKGAMRV